jgi:hypothetical protein
MDTNLDFHAKRVFTLSQYELNIYRTSPCLLRKTEINNIIQPRCIDIDVEKKQMNGSKEEKWINAWNYFI